MHLTCKGSLLLPYILGWYLTKQPGISRTSLWSLRSALSRVRPRTRCNFGKIWNWILFSQKSSTIFRIFYHLSHPSLMVQLFQKKEIWYACTSFRSYSSVYPEPSHGCFSLSSCPDVTTACHSRRGMYWGKLLSSAFLIPDFTMQITLFLEGDSFNKANSNWND